MDWLNILLYMGVGGMYGKTYMDETEDRPDRSYKHNRWSHVAVYVFGLTLWPVAAIFAYLIVPRNIREMLK